MIYRGHHKSNQSLLWIALLPDNVTHQIIESRIEFISSEDAVEHRVDSSVSELYECICFGGISGLACEEVAEFNFPCFQIKTEAQPQFIPDEWDMHFLEFVNGVGGGHLVGDFGVLATGGGAMRKRPNHY